MIVLECGTAPLIPVLQMKLFTCIFYYIWSNQLFHQPPYSTFVICIFPTTSCLFCAHIDENHCCACLGNTHDFCDMDVLNPLR